MALNPTDSRTREFVIGLKEQVFVGSDEASNDFVLSASAVSRRHASIAYRGGRCQIADLNSTNGTFVNGRRVTDWTNVQDGDEIRFGAARFIFSASDRGIASRDDRGAAVVGTGSSRRPHSLSARTLAEVVLVTFVLGFGAAQYLAYRLYHEQNRLLLAKAVPLPALPALRKASAAATPAPSGVGLQPQPQKVTQANSELREPAKTTTNVPKPGNSPGKPRVRLNELRGAVTLTGLFSGSGASGGEIAPDFVLQNLRGDSVSLSAFRGKVVLLNFWATWCPSCRGEMPSLAKLYRDFGGRSDLVLLTVSVDQGGAVAVQPFVQENGYEFPVLLDPDDSISRKYEVSGIPSTFLIGRAGEILWNCAGGIDWSSNEIEKVLKETLGSPSATAAKS
ncbi:MAG: redoxin domain-containing protein [Candidatus Binataceae bacterium]